MLTRQWFRGATPIADATGTTYTTVAADLGQTLTLKVTGAKPGYTPLTKSSAATAAVKSATTVTVSGKGAKRKATLTITVKGTGTTVKPTGKVTIKLGSKTLKTVTLKSGKVIVTFDGPRRRASKNTRSPTSVTASSRRRQRQRLSS